MSPDIQTFNVIAKEGLAKLQQAGFTLNQTQAPIAALVRSQPLHDWQWPSSLLAIARAGAGTNNVPLERATAAGVVVFNTPGANANAVKELVLASLLLSVRPILKGAQWVQTLTGDISSQVEQAKQQFSGTELEGKRLGVIGLGAIGALVANDAYRLGMEVVGYDPFVSVDTAWNISRRVQRAADLSAILACDFITLHMPLTDKTRHFINAKLLQKIRPETILLNFSRGELVDTPSLLAALAENRLKGYVTDFAEEALLQQENILVLPHLGAATIEAEVNCAKMAAKSLVRFWETGAITHSVNFPTVDMAFHSPLRITIIHENVPNMLGQISTTVADFGLNIDHLINNSRGDYAYTMIDVSSIPQKSPALAQKLQGLDHVIRVRFIKNQRQVSD